MAVRDITLGQYYPGDSSIHRLDPRVKIVCALVYLVSLFVVKSFWAFGLCILFLAAVIILSGVPFRFISKGLKPVVFLIIITMLINILFVRTGDPVLTIGKFYITNEGVYRALFM
ncbi:MAG: energy-coupling factor transporter transmembrane protein EcfT, partial [Firmicutes bacterium]|nr:energy-coupling factor transporter transmembrane protein EcfT [Bacillota bacterium]